MQSNYNRIRRIGSLYGVIALLAFMLTVTVPAFAQHEAKYWTTAGSAGTVDETDASKIVYSGGVVSLKGAILPPTNQALALPPTSGTTTAVIRYNVVPVDGLFQPGDLISMRVRYKDDGGRARVQVRLFEQNIETGATTMRLNLDTNVFPASPFFQVQSVASVFPAWNAFDFANNAYYVEVVLSREDTIFVSGEAAVAVVQLYRTQQIH